MKSILKFFGFMFILIFAYALLLNSQGIKRLYHLSNLFEERNIAPNFRGMKNYFSTKEVLPSNKLTPLVEANGESYQLPNTFFYDNFDVSSDYFIRYTETDALLVIKDNALVYEEYFNDYKAEDLHISWSISKSIISLLTGIALADGSIKNVNDLARDYYPELKSTAYKNVTINNLLQMTSGVKFNEDYIDPLSDANIFGYYLGLNLSFLDYIQTLKLNDHQGKHQYTSIDIQVLGKVISNASDLDLSTYLSEKIWSKAGMKNTALWITDGHGEEFSAGGFNATAKDYGALAKLIANEGLYENKQLVPKEWLADIGSHDTTVTHENYKTYDYSKNWWVPQDTQDQEILAIGIYDQYLYINRAKNVVVVKLSANHNFIKDKYISQKQSLALFRAITESLD